MKQNSNFILSLTLLLCLVWILGACGRNTETENVETTEISESEETEKQMPPPPDRPEPPESVQQPPEAVPEDREPADLLDLFRIAIEPLGSTLYVWGGGWNEADNAAGDDARTMGIRPRWKEYFEEQDGSYNFENSRHQIHDGLDCSGYIGWVVYNTLEKQDGQDGYVYKAGKIAGEFSRRGLGSFIPSAKLEKWQTGDIFCNSKHAGFIVAVCEDDSLLILHDSPPGLSFSGTRLPSGGDSQAMAIASKYMNEKYPEWQAKFDRCTVPSSYLDKSYAFRWNPEVMADPEGLMQMDAEEIMETIFDGPNEDDIE